MRLELSGWLSSRRGSRSILAGESRVPTEGVSHIDQEESRSKQAYHSSVWIVSHSSDGERQTTYPRYRRLTIRRDRWDEKDPDPPFPRCLTWLVSLFRAQVS